MRVLVTGGRDFSNRQFLFNILDRIHTRRPIDSIIEGEASGADSLAREWGEHNRIEILPYPADWKLYGKRAGRVRNCKMLRESHPDLVVAFQGGKGTSHMVEISKEAGVKVLETWKLNS
jgi:hypothetical protein